MNKRNFILTSTAVIVAFLLYIFTSPDNKINEEAYILTWGRSLFPNKSLFLDGDKNHSDFAWNVFYLQKGPLKILIDTGTDSKDYLKKFKINSYSPVEKLLQNLDLEPNQISHILLTHAHEDHVGNLGKFRNSRIYLHEYTLNKLKKSKKGRRAIDKIGIKMFTTFRDELEIVPGIRMKHHGGHTSDSSSVVFETSDNRKFLFTGDNCYIIEQCSPPWRMSGSVHSQKEYKEFQAWLQNSNYKIIPSHTPELTAKVNNVQRLF